MTAPGGPRAATAEEIRKDPDTVARANVRDLAAARRAFTWGAARRRLDGLPGGRGLNIAHEAVDRHAAGPAGDRPAVRCHGRDGTVRSLTYAGLAAESARFANVLRDLGVRPGDRVFAATGPIPELYVAAIGTLKARAVFCPLFSAFGPEPMRERLALGAGAVLVTTSAIHAARVGAVRDRLPLLRHVIVVGGPAAEDEGTHDWGRLMAAAEPSFRIGPTRPSSPALLHFTSGTTGTPKGAVHVHEAVVAHHATAAAALDLREGDVFWCTADPGWVTGTSYGIVAPLVHGLTSVVVEGDFDPGRWLGILAEERVSVWYTAPTAVRMLMRAGAAPARPLPALRFVASVGEALNPEAVRWGVEALGLPIHDNWWQTETGAIMIANLAALPIRPGSMGVALPGVDAAILAVDDRGAPVVEDGVARLAPDGAEGQLALRPGWPSMFRGYLGQDARYRAAFAGGWYVSGDVARRDRDGYFWFVGRGDDVIKSSGHLIGPFEVESALMEHPAVAEAGVVGLPDPVAGELVTAFVALRPGFAPSGALERELRGFARARLGAAIAPRTIRFRDALPHTRSGKTMRRVLRDTELGRPAGDLSTLEGGP
ncbi:MAG TPA: acetate--CoA ligase [Miltoncostaeaceae bacterium]|nr:acetate--CoA ligase [Miltoncostaeaceae bacterium]